MVCSLHSQNLAGFIYLLRVMGIKYLNSREEYSARFLIHVEALASWTG